MLRVRMHIAEAEAEAASSSIVPPSAGRVVMHQRVVPTGRHVHPMVAQGMEQVAVERMFLVVVVQERRVSYI